MTDAISRRRVLNALEAEKARLMEQKDAGWPFTTEVLVRAVDNVHEFIKGLPALDVAPVVHARWIMNHFGAKCSNCLRLYCMEPSWSEKIKHMPPTWIYCPNCGARMDGEIDA